MQILKPLIIGMFVLVVLGACSPKQQVTTVQRPTPEDVVRTYFTAWNTKDYGTMYQQISEGFKQIDPQAKDIQTFSASMAVYFEKGDALLVQSVKETSNNGKKATVEYTILMKLKSDEKPFSGTYTLKKRVGGWKLIHPYGENVDTT